jgi:hypothetical protein
MMWWIIGVAAGVFVIGAILGIVFDDEQPPEPGSLENEIR